MDVVSVAFLGPRGTYSHLAVTQKFGSDCQLRESPTITDVFASVDSGRSDFGVVPVENSTEGAVNTTQDCLIDSGLNIIAEIVIPIEHSLLVRPGTKLEEITTIVSHQQSLAQCREWLCDNFPTIPQQESLSNAQAALKALHGAGVAAIAGSHAAELYGLEIARGSIQDQLHNKTRFLVLSRNPVPPTGDDKTSVLIYAENKPGSLFRILEPFEKLQISLTKLETRPSKKEAWEYVFFIDFEGHREEEYIRELFQQLQGRVSEIKVLGSYPIDRTQPAAIKQ